MSNHSCEGPGISGKRKRRAPITQPTTVKNQYVIFVLPVLVFTLFRSTIQMIKTTMVSPRIAAHFTFLSPQIQEFPLES